ncbi:MAG: hypothetical protein IPG97_14095 [Microthrixaceae bacterium]|nr:hypothetical protein [Microthrixaceae bacterium]
MTIAFSIDEARRYRELRPLLVIELVLLWLVIPPLLILAAGQGYRAGVLEDEGLFGRCSVESVSTMDAIEALFTRNVDGCEVPDSANTWRGFFGIGLAIAFIANVYLTVTLLMFGPVSVTAEDVGQAILQTIGMIVVLCIAALVLFIYAIVIAFAFMCGITILAAISSTGD